MKPQVKIIRPLNAWVSVTIKVSGYVWRRESFHLYRLHSAHLVSSIKICLSDPNTISLKHQSLRESLQSLFYLIKKATNAMKEEGVGIEPAVIDGKAMAFPRMYWF